MPGPAFHCLGIAALGICSYDPAHPYQSYFTAGSAIAALGFTLAIQQLLKPIYRFRIRAYGLKLVYLPVFVFTGAFCSIIAMLLPNLPIPRGSPLSYPLVWELIGFLLIAAAYVAVAIISLVPARINTFNLNSFSRAAARLLAAANDDDRVAFAEDLLTGNNLERLISYAGAWELAERHGATVEFERLRTIGAPLQITGPPPISAFYLFSHRRELEAATTAAMLLRILSDPDFCAVLVRKCPWLTADFLRTIAERRLHDDQAKSFIQEIAHQAIASEESMLAKETSYKGFASIPVLSQSLFGSWHILHYYQPLDYISDRPAVITGGYVRRLNVAASMMLKTAIKGQEYWHVQYMWGVKNAYEGLSNYWRFLRPEKPSIEFVVGIRSGIENLYKTLTTGLTTSEPERRKGLFILDKKAFPNDLVEIIASTAAENLMCFANGFKGFEDEGWHVAIGLYLEAFPQGDERQGMNPLQQHLALILLEKLSENMEGWYPAISRVLLAVVGPYEKVAGAAQRNAYNLFRDAVYSELKKLPQLHANNPEKFDDFLPPNVTYDAKTNSLTHTYRSGNPVSTNLGSLKIPQIDLTDERNWDLS